MDWRRWPDWKSKMRVIRETVIGQREGGGTTDEAGAPSGQTAERRETDGQSMSKMAQTLMRDIREAHRDWVNAHRHFEYAAGFDQIDYAIYAIEAAEKRYEMLLRQAKKLNVQWRVEWEKGAGAG